MKHQHGQGTDPDSAGRGCTGANILSVSCEHTYHVPGVRVCAHDDIHTNTCVRNCCLVPLLRPRLQTYGISTDTGCAGCNRWKYCKYQIIFALLSCSLPVVTQIRGHRAGPSPPSPLLLRYAPSFYRETNPPSSSLVDSRRIVPTHAARRSQQLILFLHFCK